MRRSPAARATRRQLARAMATVSLSLSALCAMTVAVSTNACGGGGYDVARVHDGRVEQGRFVSDEAYQASLEASLAEAKGDWASAAAALRIARDADPDAPELQARLGLALCHLGKLDAARFAFDDALRDDPALERAYTSRAQCALLSQDDAAARADLRRAIEADPDALEPALLLAQLEATRGPIALGRARAAEATRMHPQSAEAYRVLAEILVATGDVDGAVRAATRAASLDEVEGARARVTVRPLADRSGVVSYGLSMRGLRATAEAEATAPSARCSRLLVALAAIAARGSVVEVSAAASGTRAECPENEGEATLIEAEATWSPGRSEAIEALALEAPSAATRRWGVRMRLRHLSTDRLLEAGALPRVDDRETLALSVAASALTKARAKPADPEAIALASSARDLAMAEPTVARLVSAVARAVGRPATDAWRVDACALARTNEERSDCAK